MDKNLIKNVIGLDKNTPKAVEHFFRIQTSPDGDTTKENLGFGWKRWTQGVGGGYISIHTEFIYYHDSIVSYTIMPQMPDEPELVEKYKSWYQESFSFIADKILDFTYQAEKIRHPLKEYKGILTEKDVTNKILIYMTPSSGTTYGFSGGYDGRILLNRKFFIELSDSLTNDKVVLLMYSINPASRFTAIEYYLKHKKKFKDTTLIDEWIERNFQELPTVETLSGCIRHSMDTRTLVEMYSSWKTKKMKFEEDD